MEKMKILDRNAFSRDNVVIWSSRVAVPYNLVNWQIASISIWINFFHFFVVVVVAIPIQVWDDDIYVSGAPPPYPITSVSAALAWGLPDQPTYPENDLMQLYEEGDLPLAQKRKDTNATNNIASNTPIPPTPSANHIDPETILKLIRLFLPADDYMELDSNYIQSIMNYIDSFEHNLYQQDSSKYWNTSATSTTAINHANPFNANNNYYRFRDNATHASKLHAPFVSSKTDMIHRAENAFKKYLVETYFRPWIHSASTERCVYNVIFIHCRLIIFF